MKRQVVRYIINGLVATGVHFLVLSTLVEQVQLESAGTSNLIASVFGISASFLGNRFFVFAEQGKQGRLATQGIRFLASYALIALVHYAVMTVWTDMAGLDYRIGFLVAMVFQVVLGYLANKHFVFRGEKSELEPPLENGPTSGSETHLAP